MSETTQKVAELKQILPSAAAPVTLQPQFFALDAAYIIRTSHVRLPAGVSLEACLRPEFWAHVAAKLTPGQRILVDADDGAFSAQLKVHHATRIAAAVSVEWAKTLETAALPVAASPEDDYRIHWAGGAKFRVSRNSDNATISDGHATKEIARAALMGHLQAMAA